MSTAVRFSVDVSIRERGRKAKSAFDLKSDLSGEATFKEFLEFTKRALIITSDQVYKISQQEGFEKTPLVEVDGRVGKPVQNVHPLGKIAFVANQNIKDILLAAYDALEYRSPVLTGRYKHHHFVFHNGKHVASVRGELEAWLDTNPEMGENDRIRIVNMMPYARKLERYGITAQRSRIRTKDLRKQKNKPKSGAIFAKVPNGAYYLTARAIKRVFKSNININFSFISGSEIGLSGVFKTGKKHSIGRAYVYPSLLFTVRRQGLK